jgi:hypothetical protein
MEYNKLIIGDYEQERCTGGSVCCWERPKNGKYAPFHPVPEMLKIRHSTRQGQGGILAVLLLSDKVSTSADNS